MEDLKRKYLLCTFLLINVLYYSQIIKIGKRDSIQLEKKEMLKEGNLTFYKNEYRLTIYNIEHINYNKKNGYKKTKIAGGLTYCEKCKKENYYFILKKVNQPKTKSLICLNELLGNIKKYQFYNLYFLIQGKYYKSLGMPID